jgi:23S rRNA pseudouridine1911/1915/1917 synthase
MAGPESGAGAESVLEEVVPAALAGERLDRLVALLTGSSRAEAAAAVETGAVRVGGVPVRNRAHRVAAGDVVAVRRVAGRSEEQLRPDPSVVVPVLYEDDDVVVVDKPAGLVVHPGAGHRSGTLVHGLLARYPQLADVGDPERPGLVHRLDRDTSGLLVVARSPAAHAGLVRALAERSVERGYLTLVWGHPEARSGLIDAPIGRSARARTKMTVSRTGREARTRYEVRRSYDRPVAVALLGCRLETGRTHQIRVHLAAIGHPVVGDDRYGGVRPSFPVPRLFLHAEALAFRHPVTGVALSFRSPLPADLQGVLDRLDAAAVGPGGPPA